MAKHESAHRSPGQRLKGNVMLSKKETLRKFENITVNLMIEFYLDESDHIKEAEKLASSIDTIVQMARKRWGQ